MNQKLNQALLIAGAKILKPLIRLFLRYGIGFSAFSDLCKRLYVEVSEQDFAIPGKKQTASRISTMTGLSRKEVTRVGQLAPIEEDDLASQQINRAARVVSGWASDAEYHNDSGEPLDLPFEADGPCFTELVKKYSGDITARTIADELMRVGAISTVAQGKIRLNKRAYVPDQEQIHKLAILGNDVQDLMHTIEHNLLHGERPFFQRKVEYMQISSQGLEELRDQLSADAQQALENLQKIIKKNATMAKSDPQYRLGIGIYYFQKEESHGQE